MITDRCLFELCSLYVGLLYGMLSHCCIMSFVLCCVLITRFMFLLLVLCFSSSFVCFAFCVTCSVFCVLFLLVYIVVSFLFVYLLTDHCHRVETHLQIYRIIIILKKMLKVSFVYVGCLATNIRSTMFAVHEFYSTHRQVGIS